MKLSLLLFVSLYCSFSLTAARQQSDAVGNVEGEHDDEFDQELFAGGEGARKKISDLPPELAAEEIRKLISRIDEDDDGKVSKAELKAWLKAVEDHSYQEEADKLFVKEDSNADGFIMFEEFWANTEGGDLPTEGEELDDAQAGLATRFQDADGNGDGRLDKKEFMPFIHPFRHQHMIAHLVEDQLGQYDTDQDGMISLEEYLQSFNPEHLPEDSDWVEDERAEFTEHLDRDHDGFLDHSEIKEWLAPNEETFFEQEAQHLLKHADKDEDGFLTVEEVEAEFDVFMDSSVTDYGHMVHEEL